MLHKRTLKHKRSDGNEDIERVFKIHYSFSRLLTDSFQRQIFTVTKLKLSDARKSFLTSEAENSNQSNGECGKWKYLQLPLGWGIFEQICLWFRQSRGKFHRNNNWRLVAWDILLRALLLFASVIKFRGDKVEMENAESSRNESVYLAMLLGNLGRWKNFLWIEHSKQTAQS